MSRDLSVRRGRPRGRVTSIIAITAVAAAILAGTAIASVTLTRSRTFTLHAHSTATYNVRYPAALKFPNARYSCTAKVSGPGKSGVRILSRGSAEGGTVCRVKARNRNKFEDPLDDARIKVIAKTTY